MRSVRSLLAAVLSKIVGERLTNVESLPDDLVFTILVQLPPQDLRNGARLVCRQWYRIINSPDFIHENLQHSPPGLLIQYWGERRHSVFVAMQQGRIKISELNYKLFKGYCIGSCNGFVVDNSPMGGIYVMNPTTEKRYALPPIPVRGIHNACAVMAYVAVSKEYKLVLTYSYSSHPVNTVRCCAILTVGVDRDWRHISTEHLSLTTTEFSISFPLIAGGFIYWTDRKGTRVLTLNVETEVFTSTPVPKGYDKRLKYYLSTGSCLTMVVACGKLAWEVWELKQESGEWMKLYEIDLEAQKGRIKELVAECSGNYHIILEPVGCIKIETLEPVGWLDYGEVLVLHASTPSCLFFLYNVRTRRIDSFQLNDGLCYPRFQFHRNSLLHLGYVWLLGNRVENGGKWVKNDMICSPRAS